jgi:hypothetical protein
MVNLVPMEVVSVFDLVRGDRGLLNEPRIRDSWKVLLVNLMRMLGDVLGNRSISVSATRRSSLPPKVCRNVFFAENDWRILESQQIHCQRDMKQLRNTVYIIVKLTLRNLLSDPTLLGSQPLAQLGGAALSLVCMANPACKQ